MNRLFYKKLKDWKISPDRKPLIVRGARQVGKTYIIKQFGKDCFPGNVHVVDLEKHADWHGVFEKNLDPGRIISELEVLLNSKIAPGKDLLFLDEIQAVPGAIMSLRYFFENLPELHVIAAGSLLDFAMKEIRFPVGRVQIRNMFPMNFSEFLMATGKEQAADLIRSEPTKLPDPIHSMLLESLKQYIFVGGMPECVKSWCNSHSMTDVFEIQSDLVESYRQDFSKYAPYVDKRSLNHALTTTS